MNQMEEGFATSCPDCPSSIFSVADAIVVEAVRQLEDDCTLVEQIVSTAMAMYDKIDIPNTRIDDFVKPILRPMVEQAIREAAKRIDEVIHPHPDDPDDPDTPDPEPKPDDEEEEDDDKPDVTVTS